MAGRTKELTLSDRERIINLRKNGFSQRKIGELVGKPRATVQSLIWKYKLDALITNRPRQGRPRKLSEREERAVLREVTKNLEVSVAQLYADVKENTGKYIVVFQSEIFHPVIDSETSELNLLKAFPKWNKTDQHLWQVLKYIQWIFENISASCAHAINKEAEEMFKSNQNAFTSKAQELVKLSKDHLYDGPPTEDKHYIIFEPYVPELHDKVRASMITYQKERISKIGHSWVLPGNYKSLTRPPTPPSENES